jgi:hypothetical protein
VAMAAIMEPGGSASGRAIWMVWRSWESTVFSMASVAPAWRPSVSGIPHCGDEDDGDVLEGGIGATGGTLHTHPWWASPSADESVAPAWLARCPMHHPQPWGLKSCSAAKSAKSLSRSWSSSMSKSFARWPATPPERLPVDWVPADSAVGKMRVIEGSQVSLRCSAGKNTGRSMATLLPLRMGQRGHGKYSTRSARWRAIREATDA